MSDDLASMIATLEKKTGHSLDWWIDQADKSGKSKHGKIVSYLKTELGLTHGYANRVVLAAKERASGGPASAQDLVDGQYREKENLRPIYEAVLAAATALGTDVEVVPKKAGVSLRRSKQFALVEPTTKTRVDLGINLKGVAPAGRLVAVGGMCTHKVSITDPTQIDAELLGWLTAAYERA